MSNWLQVLNLSPGEEGAGRSASVLIDGVIGSLDWYDMSGTTAAHFMRTVDALGLGEGDEINVQMNTPGGVISDGVTITNYLINHPASVSVTVMGQAASIGSVIAQAADPGKLHMALGTTQFVHDPITGLMGDADELRAAADTLDKYRDSIISIYQRRVNLSEDEIKNLMRDNTTMTAEEAVTCGFADTMDATLKAVACADLPATLTLAHDNTMMAAQARNEEVNELESLRTEVVNLTAQLTDYAQQSEPADAVAVIEACNTAQLTALAGDFISARMTMDQVNDRITAVNQVRDICAAANVSPDDYINHASNAPELLRMAMVNMQAALDQQINNELLPGGEQRTDGVINFKDIYTKRNQHKLR